MISIAQNYSYNLLYNIISIIIPFITVPYVSRVLGAEGIGVNAYTSSIMQYFILFGTLGIGLYGGRSIAYVRDDKEKLSKTFWSIFMLQFTLCMTSFVLYLIFVVVFIDNYRLIQLIQSLNIFAAAIDVCWLFVGIEDFRKLVVRSVFFRILGVISIFLFVKDIGDLWKYTTILSLSVLLGQVVMWAYLNRIVDKGKVGYKDIIMHLRPSFKLFIPQMAIQVYLILNKTMLGVIASKQEVGLYENADRIIRISLAIITATGGVMLPRISNSFAKGDKEKVNYYVYTILNFVSYLGIPIMLGIIGVSVQFIPWFLGSEFIKCIEIVIILSPIVIAIAWSNVMGFQYMIPTGKTNGFTVSVIGGAIVNLSLNALLIRRFYSTGAAIATVLAEITVTGIQMYLLRNDIKIQVLYKNLIKYLISGIVMFTAVVVIGNIMGASARTTAFQVSSGAFIYLTTLFLLKSDINIFIFTKLFDKVYRRFARKKAEA